MRDQPSPAEPTGAPTGETAERLPRKERERLRHRRDVLRAVEGLLLTRSFRDISVQEIAEQAEFSVGYLYKIFPNKEEILYSLLQAKQEAFARIMDEQVAAEAPIVERLHGLVHRIFGYVDQNLAYMTSSLRDITELTIHNPRLRAEKEKLDKHARRLLNGFFREAVEAGVLAGASAEEIRLTFGALVFGFIREELQHGTEPRDWARYAHITLRVITRAYAPEGEGTLHGNA